MGDLVKVCGLWSKDTPAGQMLSGNLGQVRVVILPNKYKKEETHPDYNLFIAPKDDDRNRGERRTSGASRDDDPPRSKSPEHRSVAKEDDVPF